ncbi:hypothetical protein [Nocardioides sp. MH1]|uniref:hypothetical protein n=1 Tax=Nocardioides sp. MH1 TaxID=3242490 RepID=UPI0035224642
MKRAVERSNDRPSRIDVGADFKHDGFAADAGWDVVELRGTFTVSGLSLTNDAIGDRAAFLDFTLYRHDELVGTISCSTHPIPHGESGRADCFSGDDYTAFDAVAVADTF